MPESTLYNDKKNLFPPIVVYFFCDFFFVLLILQRFGKIKKLVFPMYVGPVVQTTYGSVQGFTAMNGEIDVFYGIPFAKPPVGELRFEVNLYTYETRRSKKYNKIKSRNIVT